MSDQSRRKLLKSIAAGSGAIVAGKSLPESWSRPVVDSVMLPAHAQTSEVVTYILSCESASAPIGSHTSPGPDVDVTAGSQGLIVDVAVTPAPTAPDNVVQIQRFLNGGLLGGGPLTLAADGTVQPGINSGTAPGILEARFTWGSQQCSLFWNIIFN